MPSDPPPGDHPPPQPRESGTFPNQHPPGGDHPPPQPRESGTFQNQHPPGGDHPPPQPRDSGTFQNQQPPPPPQQPNDNNPHPPAMGLPAQMAYPPGPYPPHYPSPYNHPQYPYAQAPPPLPYPYSHQQGLYTNPNRSPQRFGPCICCFIIALILFIILLAFSNLITWLTLRSQIPKFRIDSLSVSNFNTSTPFTANWEAKLEVDNSKRRLTVYFDWIETAVLDESDYRLGKGFLIPFFIEKKSEMKVSVSVATNGSAADPVPIWVAQSMEKERSSKGAVKFAMVFGMKTTIKGWFTRHITLKIMCKDLKVNLPNGASKGDLAKEDRDDCSLRL